MFIIDTGLISHTQFDFYKGVFMTANNNIHKLNGLPVYVDNNIKCPGLFEVSILINGYIKPRKIVLVPKNYDFVKRVL